MSRSTFALPLKVLSSSANLARLDFVATDDDNRRAHFRQFKRRLFADAIGRAGDEYSFAEHHNPPRVNTFCMESFRK